MSRPTGAPGVVDMPSGFHTAVLDRDGQLWVYLPEPPPAAWVELDDFWHEDFTPDDVPEWVAACEHELACDAEAECDRQAAADDRQARKEGSR